MHRSLITSCTVGVLALATLTPAAAANAAVDRPATTVRNETARHALTIATDRYLPGDRVTVGGTAAPGERVTVFFATPDNPNDFTTVVADGQGRWSATSSSYVFVADAFTVRATNDPLGQSQGVSKTLTADDRRIDVDTTTYRVGGKVTISGSANPGVKIFAEFPGSWNASNEADGVVDSSGHWELTSERPVSDRDGITVALRTGVGAFTERVEHPLSARFHDLTVDTTAYVPGLYVTLEGSSDPGATVTGRFSDTHGLNTGSATADDEGHWTMRSKYPVPDLESTTVSVATGTGDEELRVERTLTASTPSLTVDTSTYEPGQQVTVSGHTDPLARVSARFSGPEGNVMTANADERGAWRLTSKFAVVETESTTVRVTAGISGAETVREQTLRAERAVAPITVTTKTFTTGQKQKIEGTAQPGARIDIYLGTRYLMNTTADQNGNWNYTTGSPITDPTFTRTLKSQGTNDVTFTLTAKVAPITVTTRTYTHGQKLTVEGTAEPGARVNVYDGNAFDSRTSADRDGKWTYTTSTPVTDRSYTRTLQSDDADLVTFTLTAR